MRLVTKDELSIVAGGADQKEADAEELKKRIQKKVCGDLAEKAWNECKKNFACRSVLDQDTTKKIVTNECNDSFKKAGG